MSTSRRFQFIRLIASGGFGDVYLCKEFNPMGVSRLVAVKLLKSKWSDNEEIVQRVRDEARLLALLRHRNIINVFDLTSLKGRAAVVMEYLEAIDLSQIILQMKEMRRRVPLRVCLETVAAVASALDAAYNQPPFPGEKPLRVIHRDIKPSNIMLDGEGIVKVLDFGVAHSEFDTRESQTRELQFGSFGYMAPERLFSEPETPSSDVYSLGSTLFETISSIPFGKAMSTAEKHNQFVRQRIAQLMKVLNIEPAVQEELSGILAGSLSFDTADRISAVELSQRARNLSRSISGPDLVSWAERAVPHLRERRVSKHSIDGSLNGSIVEEDSAAFRIQTKAQDKEEEIVDQGSLRRGALAELEPDPNSVSVTADHTDLFSSMSSDDSHLEELTAAKPIRSQYVPYDNSVNTNHEGGPRLSEVPMLPEPPMIEDDTSEVTNIDTSISELIQIVDGISDNEKPQSDISAGQPQAMIPKPVPMSMPSPPSRQPQPPFQTTSPPISGPQPPKKRSPVLFVLGGALVGLVSLGILAFLVFTNLQKNKEPAAMVSAEKSASDPKKTEDKTVNSERPPKGTQAVHVRSKAPGTRKISVSCDGKKGKGSNEAFTPLGMAKSCKVQAILSDRSRVFSVIKSPKVGTYNCFARQSDDCILE